MLIFLDHNALGAVGVELGPENLKLTFYPTGETRGVTFTLPLRGEVSPFDRVLRKASELIDLAGAHVHLDSLKRAGGAPYR